MDAVTNELILEFNYDSSVDTKRQITYSKINILASYLGISDHFYHKVEETVITYLRAKAVASFIGEERKIINEHRGEDIRNPINTGFWVATDGKRLYFNDLAVKFTDSDFYTRKVFLFITNEVEHRELFEEVLCGIKRVK